MGYGDIGKAWSFPSDSEDFRDHVRDRGVWKGCKGVTFHHSWEPSLAQRPDGLSDQHLRNIRDYYSKQLGWSAGPHLFVDDHRVMALTPLNEKGVHAKSFNASHVGIEVVGNYDAESPYDDRGAQCWSNAILAASIILKECELAQWNFHRDDPKTDKSCPGKRVTKDFISKRLYALTRHPDATEPAQPASLRLMAIPGVVYWDLEGKQALVPIAAFLRANGVDAAWDSDTWQGVVVAYYDPITETSYGEIGPLMALIATKT